MPLPRRGACVDSRVTTTLTCTHLNQIRDVSPRTPDGCEECLQTGSTWVHLRECLTCGHVGCCDNSPNRHATAHNRAVHHPLIKSFQPDESWGYCYPDDLFFEEAPALPA